jgi:sialic acid synthase SpsE
MIISTGMSTLKEIKTAVKAIQSKGNNLRAINHLKKEFPFPIGYSDNGSGLLVPLTAVAAGAQVIEKHFTLDRKMKGPDQSFSANPKEFSELVKKIREIEKILGKSDKQPQPTELKLRKMARRSVVASCTIKKDARISKEMIIIKRPGNGISPLYLNKVIGKKARKKINSNEPLKWSYLK